MAKVLITGGSGLVGRSLSKLLTDSGHEVVHLSRTVSGAETYKTYKWDLDRMELDPDALHQVDHIVHLAGAGVADKKWTDQRKKLILDSRVESLKLLHQSIKDHQVKLRSFISASAIGYYGSDTGDTNLKEDAPAGNDFLAAVVKAWEAEADKLESLVKVAKVRIGVVLSEKGGALPAIAQPIRFLVGAPLGTGSQYMSWIHIEDLSAIFKYILEQDLSGTYNAVAPNPVTNKKMTQQIAKSLKKPLILPNVPAFVMNLLLGEMSQIVLGGNKVSSVAIAKKGFQFKFTQVSEALANLLRKD